jgi:hypothetical protein
MLSAAINRPSSICGLLHHWAAEHFPDLSFNNIIIPAATVENRFPAVEHIIRITRTTDVGRFLPGLSYS